LGIGTHRVVAAARHTVQNPLQTAEVQNPRCNNLQKARKHSKKSVLFVGVGDASAFKKLITSCKFC
jgi:hypothetical protein